MQSACVLEMVLLVNLINYIDVQNTEGWTGDVDANICGVTYSNLR